MSNDDNDKVIDLHAVSERFRQGQRPHIADHQAHGGGEVEGGDDDELLAYVEVMWGFETWQCHTAIRDIEALRRGTERDKALRHPETDHEKMLLLVHLRSLANDLARDWGLSDFIRMGDDLHTQPEEPEEPGDVPDLSHDLPGVVIVVEDGDGKIKRVVPAETDKPEE
jgi:hypothetical protein